jgi:hypothetical protein
MTIIVASRRAKLETLRRRHGEAARIIDVTSRGESPWVRFSPFYPHGHIPVPFSPGVTAMSVEGIWQGLKVFESADVDVAKFAISSLKGIKRSARVLGRVLGHREGVEGARLLDYAAARRRIYLPSYRWVLERCLGSELADLEALAREAPVVLLDYETNEDMDDLSRPLSHAALVKRFVERRWP